MGQWDILYQFSAHNWVHFMKDMFVAHFLIKKVHFREYKQVWPPIILSDYLGIFKGLIPGP